jgi:hypothetical protein
VPPETVIATPCGLVARKAVSAAVIAAVSCVALTKVVGRGEPFQLTTRPLAKPVPVTVSVRPDKLQKGVLFAKVVDADSAVTVGSTIGKATTLDLFALAAGLATAICAVPTAAISADGTVAISCAGFACVAATNVVGNCVVVPPLVHCTTEHGRMFVPVTVNVAPADPAVADAGNTVEIVGTASDPEEIVKGKVFERTPPLDTPMFTAPADAISEAGMIAESRVELTKVVANADVITGVDGVAGIIQSTTDPFTKLVPVTVIVTGEVPHDDVVEDDNEVIAGGTIVNCTELERPPPGPRVNTST